MSARPPVAGLGSADAEAVFTPIVWRDQHLLILDQTRLPQHEEWLRCDNPEQVADAISRLAVRGAPALGVAAAYGLALQLLRTDSPAELARAHALLAATRPTAVNLRWALDQGAALVAQLHAAGATDAPQRLLDWARSLHRADIETNRRLAQHGAAVLPAAARVLTHCNTGALATGGVGTALGVITHAYRLGRVASVWVDETRPLLQGARLTAWELGRAGVPYRLVTDSSVGALMARALVDVAIVGADRIAANGDTANKIGTYTAAVLAQRHGVPFYVAAPLSTVDLRTAHGDDIPIEERSPREVTELGGTRVAPEEAPALNFAFDVTPAELIAGLVTEVGVLRPPFAAALRAAAKTAG